MGFGELMLLAVGLSMDAFAVSICKGLAMKKATLKAGLTCGIWFGGFQALMPNIVTAVLLIGLFTCAFCTVGVKIGNVFGSKFENKAQMAGGIILILLGTKILLEHLGVL